MDELSFPRADGKKCRFCFDKRDNLYRPSFMRSPFMVICKGVFPNETPDPAVEPGTVYRLARIPVKAETLENPLLRRCLMDVIRNYPHERHIRRILAWDQGAVDVRQMLEQESSFLPGRDKKIFCQMVLPAYQESGTLLLDKRGDEEESEPAAPLKKLKFLAEAVQGIQEISAFYARMTDRSPEEIPPGDITMKNFWIMPGEEEEITAILADTAAWGTDLDGFSPAVSSGGYMSPEEVGGSRSAVTQKAAVFALSGILGELFGQGNPLLVWRNQVARKYSIRISEEEEELRETLSSEYQRIEDFSEHRWLENALKGVWKWNISDAMFPGAEDRFSDLLSRATEIAPENRMTLTEFYRELCRLQRDCVGISNDETVIITSSDFRSFLPVEEEKDASQSDFRSFLPVNEQEDVDHSDSPVPPARSTARESYLRGAYAPFISDENGVPRYVGKKLSVPHSNPKKKV